jgi:hypothetical protein
MDLRTNSEFCSLQNKMMSFFNRVEECLLRGRDWVFNKIGYVSSTKDESPRTWISFNLYSVLFILSQIIKYPIPFTVPSERLLPSTVLTLGS